MKDVYWRQANLKRVVDGDTQWFYMDNGFRGYMDVEVRLYGVNCPEVVGVTKAAGLAATKFAQDWYNLHNHGDKWGFDLHSIKENPDSFGRWLVDVFCSNPIHDSEPSLNQALLDSGNAVVFVK